MTFFAWSQRSTALSHPGPAQAQHATYALYRKHSPFVHAAFCYGMRRRSRSIFGLPLISPLARPYKIWSGWIMLLDLIYTAFLVPILVGFEVPDIGWGWGCIINLVAGAGSVVPNFRSGQAACLQQCCGCFKIWSLVVQPSPSCRASSCQSVCVSF